MKSIIIHWVLFIAATNNSTLFAIIGNNPSSSIDYCRTDCCFNFNKTIHFVISRKYCMLDYQI